MTSMIRRTKCLSALALAISTALVCGQSPSHDEQKESITINRSKETGQLVTQIKSVKYERIQGYDNYKDEPPVLIARTSITEVMDEGIEGMNSNLKVDFFKSTPGG